MKQAKKYEKPEIRKIRLDVKGATLAVNCWNSTYTDPDSGSNGCNLDPATCPEA